MKRVWSAAAVLYVAMAAGFAAGAPGGSIVPVPALRIVLLGLAIDVHPGYVRISEVVHLQNNTSQTFRGDVVYPLPRGARFVTFHEGLSRPAVQDDRIVDQLTVPAGSSHQAAYAYTVAGTGAIVLDRSLLLPVERVEVFTVAPAAVHSPNLRFAPAMTRDGRTYTRAMSLNLPAGSLPMTVLGVPAVRRWPAPAAAGTLAALLSLGLGWAALSFRRRQASPTSS